MAIALGMVVIIANHSTSPHPGANEERAAVAKKIGVQTSPLSLHELLPQSDFLSVHVPLTPDTKGLIGEDELAIMKSSAVVINAARGGVVDEHGATIYLHDHNKRCIYSCSM